jgi:hypothetical protein
MTNRHVPRVQRQLHREDLCVMQVMGLRQTSL